MISICENICKAYFETIFNNKFIKVRPKWLINENGNSLELDGYCSELMLAFEYNGEQHYKDCLYSESIPLAKRQEWDLLKINTCKQYGVKLIVIPSIPKMLKLENLKEFIKKECIKQSVELPLHFESIKFNLDELVKRSTLISMVNKEISEMVKAKNGTLLTSFWSDWNRVSVMCHECNIAWEISISNLKNGKWCPNCALTKKLTLEQMQEIAATKGGRCLSNEYINAHSHLEWECANGHKWLAEATNIRNNGRWCLECAGHKKKTIEEMRELAYSKGGKCLSTEYKNAHTELQWECKNGHIWWEKPMALTNNRCKEEGRGWCQECRGRKVSIENINKIANDKGGVCLSKEYIPKVKLKFRCINGHEWFARAEYIRKGSWCSKCRAIK